MIKFLKKFIVALLIPVQAIAGLPPTTTKASGDSSNFTTFNFLFPNFTVTRSGINTTFNVNSVAGGGTGLNTLTAHSLLLGNGTSNLTLLGPAAAGTFLTGQGASSDPSFSATPTLGVNATTAGTLSLATSTASGQSVTLQNLGTTSAWNFNFPTTAGSAGQVLTSQAGGSTSMTWTTALTQPAQLSKSANYTLSTSDSTVLFTAAATATLPTSVGFSGKRFTIINGSTTPVNVPIATTSSQTIGGRASSDIVLAQYWDNITVESDGANWQIVSKKETSIINTLSSSFSIGAYTSAKYAPVPGNSISIGIGQWTIFGRCVVEPGSGANIAFITTGAVYAATGTGTSSAPTALPGTVIGRNTFLVEQTGGQSVGSTASGSTVTDLLFDYISTSTQTIYIVPLCLQAAGSGGVVSCDIQARRVW